MTKRNSPTQMDVYLVEPMLKDSKMAQHLSKVSTTALLKESSLEHLKLMVETKVVGLVQGKW